MTNKQKRILVVEDDENGQVAAKLALEELHCIVDLADCGREALKLFRDNQYDLVFMDIAILDMDGFTITEQFRQIEKDKSNKPVPILALSAYDDTSFKKRAFAVGIDNYLLKPITVPKCRKILKQLFPKTEKKSASGR
ncbi:MAG: response regulator [Gammaproteobacteria bacterium]